MVRRVLSVFLASVMLTSMAMAGMNPDAKVAVHVKGHNPEQSCGNLPVITGCADIVTTYPGYSFDAFPVFFDLTEYLALQYGMCWPSWTYSAAWTSCSDLVIGRIEWPGSGVSQTWLYCQPGPVAIGGWAWIYADGPGMVCLCPHPAGGVILVQDCHEGLDEPVCNFCAGVYGAIGDDPCWPSPTEPSSWGDIKRLFKD